MADDPYTTKLDRSQEIAYQLWRKKLPSDLQNDSDYDLRGAFVHNAKAAMNGHLTDTFKKPNHITFSSDSQYHSPETPGGTWEDTGIPNPEQPGMNKYVFWASHTNLQNTDPSALADYFKAKEKGNTVVLPINFSLK